MGYYYDGSANTLAIAAGGTYDILNDTGFADYINGSASATVANAGLLEKVGGGGISEIQPTLANTGTVQATTGTLQIDNTTNFAGGTLTGGTWEARPGRCCSRLRRR